MFSKLKNFLARITARKQYDTKRKTAFNVTSIKKETPAPLERTCEYCGKPFTTKNSRKIYCSHSCCNMSGKARLKGLPPKKIEKTCSVCGKPLEGGKRKYCADCNPYDKEPALLEKTCEHCGKSFITEFPWQKYCSNGCRKEVKKVREHAYRLKKAASKKREKTCPVCGKSFQPNGARKYCSDKCAYDAHSKQVRINYEKRRKPPQILEKTCEYCGKSFIANVPHQKYCSDSCRQMDYLARMQKKGLLPKKIERTCEICGKPLTKHAQKYCADCNPNKKPEPLKRTCLICGKIFLTRRSYAKYCSNDCRQIADSMKYKSRKNDASGLSVKTCKICGKKFVSAIENQVFCSTKCRNTYDDLQYSSNQDTRKTGFYFSQKPRPKSGKSIEQWNHEAIQCGMSYGKYRAAIQSGKTFEELKLPDPAPREEKILFECKI